MHKVNNMSSGKALAVYAHQCCTKYCTQITMNIAS